LHRLFARRMTIERDLRAELGGGNGLRVVYQPIVNLGSGEPAGFEALARWTHPNTGVVGPAEFVRVAENRGLIVELGRWVLREALHHAAIWQGQEPRGHRAPVSVNLSPRQVSDPRLVDSIAAAMAEANTPPGSLLLEVAETALMEDKETLLDAMHRLRAIGVRMMLDDFGTGYSSLSHVRRFPISALKLDRSFVRNLSTDRPSRAIASAVLHLAHGLGADVIAEGVETSEQAETIRDLGCKYGQGYHFGHPMEVEDAARWLPAAPVA
jgi:EAL domain-containing protein (putative c-di-GMP-specific phosphodiesterase class I)